MFTQGQNHLETHFSGHISILKWCMIDVFPGSRPYCGVIQSYIFSPPASGNRRPFFFASHCEDLAKLLEVEVPKVWECPVTGSPVTFLSQVWSHWAASSWLNAVQVVLLWSWLPTRFLLLWVVNLYVHLPGSPIFRSVFCPVTFLFWGIWEKCLIFFQIVLIFTCC